MSFHLSLRRTVPAAVLAATAALTVGAAPSAFAQAPAQAVSASQTVQSSSDGCPLYDVTRNGVRFRTGPGTNYGTRGLLYKGDDGTKLKTSGSWMKIRLYGKSKSGIASGTTGWVHRAYLRYDQGCVPTQY